MLRTSFLPAIAWVTVVVGCRPPHVTEPLEAPLVVSVDRREVATPVPKTSVPTFEEIVAEATARHAIPPEALPDQPDSSPTPPATAKPEPVRPDYAAQLQQALDTAARQQAAREWQGRLRIQAELARSAPPLGLPQEIPPSPEIERSVPGGMLVAPTAVRPPSTTGRTRRPRPQEQGTPARHRTLWSPADTASRSRRGRPFGVCPSAPTSLVEAAFSDPLERSCADGQDNDGNGVSDREDPHCWLDWQSPNTYSAALYESGPILLRGSVGPLSPAIPFTTPSKPAWQMPAWPRPR